MNPLDLFLYRVEIYFVICVNSRHIDIGRKITDSSIYSNLSSPMAHQMKAKIYRLSTPWSTGNRIFTQNSTCDSIFFLVWRMPKTTTPKQQLVELFLITVQFSFRQMYLLNQPSIHIPSPLWHFKVRFHCCIMQPKLFSQLN